MKNYVKWASFYLLAIVLFSIAMISCDTTDVKPPPETKIFDNLKYSGVRVSYYGQEPDPFPSSERWGNAMKKMVDYYPKTIPSGLWIVGESDLNGRCNLKFPVDTEGKIFSHTFTDLVEDHLAYFDDAGVKVFLQVEPNKADINRLIDIVMNKYKHHKCVIGFGVDVEFWGTEDYKHSNSTDTVPDQTALTWEKTLRDHKDSYRLFLKHWDEELMPQNNKGDIIFIDDAQNYSSVGSILSDYLRFAAALYPNPVYFQIGYPKDKIWWGAYTYPVMEIGHQILDRLPDDQESGIFWVDFTLKDVGLL